jgi:hypothetical protein
MHDVIILCYQLHQKAIDGIGGIQIMKALATCCRIPNPGRELLRISPKLQHQGRQTIFEAVSTLDVESNPQDRSGSSVSIPELKSNLASQSPISRKLVLDAKKIVQLKKACTSLLKDRSDIQTARISTGTIVSSVIWLSLIGAKHGTWPPKPS